MQTVSTHINTFLKKRAVVALLPLIVLGAVYGVHSYVASENSNSASDMLQPVTDTPSPTDLPTDTPTDAPVYVPPTNTPAPVYRPIYVPQYQPVPYTPPYVYVPPLIPPQPMPNFMPPAPVSQTTTCTESPSAVYGYHTGNYTCITY